MSKKGQISFFLIFIFISFIIVAIASVIVPFTRQLNIEAYNIGQGLMNDSILAAGEIQNATLRADIIAVLNESALEKDNNVDIISDTVQYSWVIILFLIAIVLFVVTKLSIELGGGFV